MVSDQSRGTKRRKKQSTDEGKKPMKVSEPKKRIQQLNYRSNIGTILKLLRKLKLSDKHKAQIRKTPFWPIVEALLSDSLQPSWCRCYNSIIIDVVQLYHKNKDAFLVSNTYVKLRKSDVKLIFGIECGKEPIISSKQFLQKGGKDLGFYRRRCENVKCLDYPSLCNMLDAAMKGHRSIDHADVARIITLILCLKLLLPTTSHAIGWHYLGCVDDITKMKRFDWVDSITETLMSSIRKSNGDPKHVHGCVMILLVRNIIHVIFLNLQTV